MKSPKLRRTMPSNMRNAAVWGTAGLQCEASAGPQEPQSNLGVFQLTQSVKQVTSFGGPFHRVRMDEAIFTDGSPQELKVAGDAAASISVGAEQSIRKMAMEGRNVQATNSNQLRFGEVQAEPNVGGSRFNQAKDSTEGVEVASKDPVIQVVHSDVQPCIAKVLSQGLQSSCKKERPKTPVQESTAQSSNCSLVGCW